jgi:hypothetical protein
MKQKKIETTTMVRVDKKLVAKVNKHTDKTRQSIGGFFELAAEEKLKRETK